MPGKYPFLFLSLSCSSSPSLTTPPPPPPSFFFLFLSTCTLFFSLPLSSSPFHFLFFSFPFSFSLFSNFLFSFIFSFLFSLFDPYPPNCSKSRGNFPPLYSMPHDFFTNFPYCHDFSFPIISSFDTWLNVSHSHKCTTWLMPCVTPLGCHVASTCSCHPMCRKM